MLYTIHHINPIPAGVRQKLQRCLLTMAGQSVLVQVWNSCPARARPASCAGEGEEPKKACQGVAGDEDQVEQIPWLGMQGHALGKGFQHLECCCLYKQD